MYFKFLVQVPVGSKIVRQTKNGVTYIDFEYDRTYDSAAKYTRPKRSTIGKQSPNDPSLMYPNQNFLKYFPEVELPIALERDRRSSCLKTGSFIVIRKIMEQTGIPEILGNHFKEPDRGLVLDLAAYSIISENNAGQYYPDYAYCHPLFTRDMALFSDSTVSDFFHRVTADQRQGFLNEWNKKKDHRERIYITYDATNKRCQAGEVDFAEYGHAKDDSSKPIINYSIAYDTENREPLFYEEYPGSINDVSQLRMMVEKAQGYGYRHIGFILDRGYFDRKNFLHMDECGYSFIIFVKGMKALVKDLILEAKGSFEKRRACYLPEYGVAGTTVQRKMYESDEKERYFHLYYSVSRENRERLELEEKLKKMKGEMKKQENREHTFSGDYEKYFYLYYEDVKETITGEDGKKREIVKKTIFQFGHERASVIEEEINLQGYFAIVTSEPMTAAQAMYYYHSRDLSEKLFRADKSFLDDHSYRVYTNEAVAAKVFVSFIALIIRNRIYTALKDEIKRLGTKPNYMTVPAALRELEKIEMVRLTDNLYRLDHAVTRTQKTILNAFGMDEAYIKYQTDQLQTELKRIMGTVEEKKGA